MDRQSTAGLLRDTDWQVTYSHEDGDLVNMFYVPTLRCATLYQRATGYFSLDVLSLAARGLDALIDAGGRMELLVGCTLGQAEVEAIEKGYEVREAVGRCMINQMAMHNEHADARKHLGYLTWMIAHGHLDVKVAIPLDDKGRMRAGLGLYHAKMGLITDAAGDQLVYRGSINETKAGWELNVESFDVNCSWASQRDALRVNRSGGEFAKLWSGQARSARVIDVPEAVKEALLKFLPEKDLYVKPPIPDAPDGDGDEEDVIEVPGAVESAEALEARRRAVWAFLRDAPARPDGAMVAVATAVVEPWPHQLRVYKRMLDSWPFRLLIADEVGLGKTIEAGLMIRHAWISGLAKRVLILTPAGVMRQWQSELYEKFNLLIPVYDNGKLTWPKHHEPVEDLEQKVGRTEWLQQPLVIASSHLMRRKDRQKDLEEAEGWDLLVLDEAHHARRGAAGTAQERGPNHLLKLMLNIQAKAASLLLLTATPMQVHPIELWDLLNVLGLPEAWNGERFLDYFQTLDQNPDAAKLFGVARLFRATEAAYGPTPAETIKHVGEAVGATTRLRQQKVLKALRDTDSEISLKRLDAQQRRMALQLLKAASPIRHLMSRSTRSLLRRYREAGLLTSPIAKRQPLDIPVELTAKERAVYEQVENYISDTYQNAGQDTRGAVGFVMTIYRRRLASSFHALRRTLTDRLAALHDGKAAKTLLAATAEEDLPVDETADEQVAVDEAALLETKALVAEEAGEIQNLLAAIAKLGTDTKALRLEQELCKAFADGYDSAIVFTQYTATLDFLKEFLAARINLPIGTYSGRGGETRDLGGTWTPRSKEQIKRQLLHGQIKLLICTDAAGEGLNLQSCGVLVNYDLPWNPMKVEQRIGRIDRIGQKYETVRVINLAYANTVEADVYFALSARIDLFQGLVGKLQPILARLPKTFEQTALGKREDRERAQAAVVHDLGMQVAQAQAEGFDIDDVSDTDLALPEMPASPVTMGQIDALMQQAELMPAGVECEPLDPRTYKIRLPGTAWTRVTTSRKVFDEQFESHQMLSYQAPVFRRLVETGATGERSMSQITSTLSAFFTPADSDDPGD